MARPTLCCAFVILCYYSATLVHSADFPDFQKVLPDYYTTEVQVTDVVQSASSYATEYYSKIDKKGSVKMYFQGDLRSIYYDNSTYQITEVVDFNCTSTDEDISDYDYYPIYHGWLNREPLVIGPSAALWYAEARKNSIKDAGKEFVRNINCDKFVLPVVNKKDNLTINYYFAPEDWTTPYEHEGLRIPVRVRITGTSSRFSANTAISVPVDLINDFAYFRPTVTDLNDLLPPIGLGCAGSKNTDDFPTIPKVFQYSAEVVSLLDVNEHDDVEVQFQKTWYDQPRLLARLDRYTRKNGYKSNLYDFNTGTMYSTQNDGSCRMAILRDVEFEIYDYGMTRRMMEPKEALNLAGDFYDMGKREIRGLKCDAYESVAFDEYFKNKKYYKLVTTVYFTESSTNIGISGETESRIPVYFLITGYSAPDKKALQLQYNAFEFNDVIWPEMYSSFKLERCYTKAESKAYFVLILEVPAKIAASMEGQDALITTELRYQISKHAKVPDMRIPFLKIDYKPTGVYATGVLLERPPALLQFYEMDSANVITHDPFIKVVTDAKNLEQCSYACVDEGDFLCKGFYFCNEACFLKSTDPFDVEEEGKATDLGFCTEYLRAEIESTNFRQAYLEDALGNLETAVLNKSVAVEFQIPNGEEIVKVTDIVIGDGPYTGVDSGDKPFSLSVEMRKLDASLETTTRVDYVGTLHECYKRCKEAGSLCSSFSFCPDADDDHKECLISSVLVVKDKIKDSDLRPDKNCNIYNLKFVDYFIEYPEKVSLLPGDKVITSVDSLDECAKSCRLEEEFKCRGFEYCRSAKRCTLHKKHILDLQPGEFGSPRTQQCIHYAARYVADYMNMGGILIDDKSDVRLDTTLDDCAKICSEELREKCKSFNFCPNDPNESLLGEGTCSLTSKLLKDDGVTIDENWKCGHFEKRDDVHDWDNAKVKSLAQTGYTKKGFTGLVIGMLALGLIVGALAFVLYSYVKSRSGGEGMAVRFMKNET